MQIITYDIEYKDQYSKVKFMPGYFVRFNKTNPLALPEYMQKQLGINSFEKMNPGCEVISIEIASKQLL